MKKLFFVVGLAVLTTGLTQTAHAGCNATSLYNTYLRDEALGDNAYNVGEYDYASFAYDCANDTLAEYNMCVMGLL